MNSYPYFWSKKNGEKCSRKNIFEIPPCACRNLKNIFASKRGGFFHQSTNSVTKMTLFLRGRISKKQKTVNDG